MKTKIEELIREHPLYSKLQIERPQNANELEPEVLLLHCKYCRDDRPFHPVGDRKRPIRTIPFPGSGGYEIPLPDLSFPKLEYYCTTCNGLFQCYLEVNLKQGYICKIGQNPPFSIAIPREIVNDLGGDITLYKNALICLSQSYGIAACIYLRRLLESKINPLLAVLYETRKGEGASAEELASIKAASEEFVFVEKIRPVSKDVSDSIPEAVDNPITLVYSRLSDGVHNRTDEECVAIARSAKAVLVRLLSDLKREHRQKKAYLEDIKVLSKSN